MSKRQLSDRKIGFTQGVAYAAALMCRAQMDAEGLIEESGIPISDFKKYADEFDLEYLNKLFKEME